MIKQNIAEYADAIIDRACAGYMMINKHRGMVLVTTMCTNIKIFHRIKVWNTLDFVLLLQQVQQQQQQQQQQHISAAMIGIGLFKRVCLFDVCTAKIATTNDSSTSVILLLYIYFPYNNSVS